MFFQIYIEGCWVGSGLDGNVREGAPQLGKVSKGKFACGGKSVGGDEIFEELSQNSLVFSCRLSMFLVQVLMNDLGSSLSMKYWKICNLKYSTWEGKGKIFDCLKSGSAWVLYFAEFRILTAIC